MLYLINNNNSFKYLYINSHMLYLINNNNSFKCINYIIYCFYMYTYILFNIF